MSKQNLKGSTSTTSKRESKMKYWAKAAAAHAFRFSSKKNIVVLLALICSVMMYHFFSIKDIATHAILYIFAFDGKVSGRMDGNVLMRNGRGRGFVVPSLVQNQYTGTARNLLSSLSQDFRGLTQPQIAAWNAFTMTVSNRFGQQKQIKGKTCYVRLNANLVNVGLPTISDPPVLEDVVSIVTTSIVATSGANTLALTFAPSPTDANTYHKVFTTDNLSPGISRPSKSAFRLIDVIPTSTATPYALGTAFVTKFGNLTLGSKVFVKVVPVNATTGQEGIGAIAETIVV